MKRLLVVFLVAIPFVFGQTQLDLSLQSKNVNFASARSTKPFKTGTLLPAVCSIAEVFFKSDALPGANIYLCVAPNLWSPVADNSGQGTASSSYSAGLGLYLSGSTFYADFSTVAGLTTPNGYSNLNDFSGGQIRVQSGSGVPAAAQCSSLANVGKVYARLDSKATNATAYMCSQIADGSFAWEGMQSMISLPVSTKGDLMGWDNSPVRIPVGSDGQVLTADSSQPSGLNWKSPSSGSGGSSTSVSTMLRVRPAFRDASGWNYASDVAANIGVSFAGTYGGAAIFASSGTQSFEIRNVPLTPGWSGSLKLLLTVGNDQGGSGTVTMAGRVKCIASGGNYVSAAFGASSSAAVTTSGQTFQFIALTLNSSACAPNQYADVELSRDNSVAGNYANSIFVPSVSLLLGES